MKKTGLLLAGLFLFTATAQAADTLDKIKKEGVINIAVPQDFPPFGSIDSDMKPNGYDIDVANLIGKALGVKVLLTPVSSANRVPFLTTGKVDLIISSLGKNEEREKVLDFSVAYAPFFNGVFGPGTLEVTKVDDLKGKTVAVTRGSIEDLELSKIAPEDTLIKRFDNNSSTIVAYLSGQTQLIATGNVVAAAIRAPNPSLHPEVKFLIKNSPCFIGVAKGQSALLKGIDEIIQTAKKNGELNTISQRWLHTDLPAELL
jgi:polar amino acid transport system substrate-binding protein